MMQSRKILLVDDDPLLVEELCTQLGMHKEFIIKTALTARDGLAQAKSFQPDLILLDLDLPDQNGLAVCGELRAHNIQIPIIMLTAADGDETMIDGLEGGANDYVTKPFRFGVLLARIRAQLRQYEQSEMANFTIGRYQFHPALKLLQTEQGDKIRLTEKETNILKYLLRNKGEVVQREDLLAEVWGYRAGVTTHTLETHIYRLRQKMETNPTQATILITESGGYRLNI